jgi:hypothetical protein
MLPDGDGSAASLPGQDRSREMQTTEPHQFTFHDKTYSLSRPEKRK